MNEKAAHINYSLADIEQYLEGRMDAKEMHNLEKAALQDPFLADAIEGYREVSFDTAFTQLNEIAAVLQAKKKEGKIITLPSKKINNWWKIAAIILLVAGVGVVSWYLTQNNVSSKELALNHETTLQQEKPSIAAPEQKNKAKQLNDTTTNRTEIQQKFEEKRNSEIAKNNSKIVPLKITEAETKDDKATMAATANRDFDEVNNEKNISSPTNKNEAAKPYQAIVPGLEAVTAGQVVTQKPTFLSGKVVDDNNRPMPMANIVLKGLSDSVTTGSDGYFSIPFDKKVAGVTISLKGYKTIDTILDNSNANLIAISKATQDLSEGVVTTALGIKRKSLTNNANTNATEAFPQGGWVSFQDYVYEKLHRMRDTLNVPVIYGNVELEFSVNEEGIPYGFKVLKSLNKESDSTVIDIIKEGPRWISASKNKKAKITIKF